MGAAASCVARVIVVRHSRLLTGLVTTKRLKGRRTPVVPSVAATDLGPGGDGVAREATPCTSRVRVEVPAIALERRAAYEEGMETTPKSTAKRDYKYFCPICMRYFRAIFEADQRICEPVAH